MPGPTGFVWIKAQIVSQPPQLGIIASFSSIFTTAISIFLILDELRDMMKCSVSSAVCNGQENMQDYLHL